MKICPLCRLPNSDDNYFCVHDGTPLPDINQGRVVIPFADAGYGAGETPTQVLSNPYAQPQPAPRGNGVLYALIGALAATVLITAGILIYVTLGDRDRAAANSNGASTGSSSGEWRNVGSNQQAGPNTVVTPLNTAAAYSNITKPSNAITSAETLAANAVNTAANAVANAARSASGADRARRFERTYSGTVDSNPVVMNLTRNGRSLSGRVTPQGSYADIFVEGYVDDDGTFSMDERSDIGVVTGVYRGRLTADGTLSGVWTKPDGGKTRSVYLRRR